MPSEIIIIVIVLMSLGLRWRRDVTCSDPLLYRLYIVATLCLLRYPNNVKEHSKGTAIARDTSVCCCTDVRTDFNRFSQTFIRGTLGCAIIFLSVRSFYRGTWVLSKLPGHFCPFPENLRSYFFNSFPKILADLFSVPVTTFLSIRKH